MKKIFFLLFLVAMLITVNSAMAGSGSSPYLSGLWYLDDIPWGYSETVIANPTSLTFQVEIAFFEDDGSFCGCDMDTMAPNSLWKFYSYDYGYILDPGDEFTVTSNNNICHLGRGHLKVISHAKCSPTPFSCLSTTFTGMTDATGPMLTGFDTMYRCVDTFQSCNATGLDVGMTGVTLTTSTKSDMANIYSQCVNFLKNQLR